MKSTFYNRFLNWVFLNLIIIQSGGREQRAAFERVQQIFLILTTHFSTSIPSQKHSDSHIVSQTHTYTHRQVPALQQRLFNYLSLISGLR